MSRDDQWSLRVDDGVLIIEFPNGTVLSPTDGDALLSRWRTLVSEHTIDVVVLVVRTSRCCSDTGRQTLRAAAQDGVANDVTQWALVAERPKRRYLKRTIDVAGTDVESFNDDGTALLWARQGPLART